MIESDEIKLNLTESLNFADHKMLEQSTDTQGIEKSFLDKFPPENECLWAFQAFKVS